MRMAGEAIRSEGQAFHERNARIIEELMAVTGLSREEVAQTVAMLEKAAAAGLQANGSES